MLNYGYSESDDDYLLDQQRFWDLIYAESTNRSSQVIGNKTCTTVSNLVMLGDLKKGKAYGAIGNSSV